MGFYFFALKSTSCRLVESFLHRIMGIKKKLTVKFTMTQAIIYRSIAAVTTADAAAD